MNESHHRQEQPLIDPSMAEQRPACRRFLRRHLAALIHEPRRSRRLVDFYLLIVLAGFSGAAIWLSRTTHLMDCVL